MWVVVNGQAVVDVVDGVSVAYSASVSDPLSTFDFNLDDTALQYVLDDFQEVIVWDENAPVQPDGFGGTIQPIPAMNYALNPTLYNNGFSTAINQWTVSGGLSALWTYATNAPALTFNNNALGYSTQYQNTLSTSVKPGVKYMFSAFLTGSGTISNIQVIVKFDWYDANNVLIAGGPSFYGTPALGVSEVTVSAVAPSNVAYVQLNFGGQAIVNGSNSGVITFGRMQFEPMWFTEQGVSYPTPDCNLAQITCVQLPDGTTSRKCRIFDGYIDNLEITYEGNQRFYVVNAISNNSLLEDYALINSSYTSEYDTFIIGDVISTYFSGVISTGQQNLQAPSSTIVQGALIPQITHVDQTFREVLNYLTNTSGFLFYLDPYFYLHYVPQYYDVATFQLSDSPDYVTTFPYESYTLQKDGSTRGNAIKLTGNKQNAAAIQDIFSGDGTTKIFNLTKPPFTVHTVTIGGTRQSKVGVDGVDVNGVHGFTVLINKQKQEAIFNGAPVSGTNNIVVDYTYEDAVIAIVQSGDSYAKYNRWFWRKVNDSNMTSTAAAQQRGIAEVTKYAFGRNIPQFTTLNLFIPVGSTVLLTSSHDGFSQAAFTVQTVSVSYIGGGEYVYQYTTGSYNPTLLDHFRNIHKAVNRPGYTSNVATQLITYDSVSFDTVTWADSIVATHSGYAYTVLQDTPIRWYRLDDQAGTSAKDVGSQAQNGTYQGGYTLNTAGLLTGSTDPAVSFGGINGFVSLPLSGLPTGASPWTMEGKINLPSIPANNSYVTLCGWGTRLTGEMATIQVYTNNVGAAYFMFSGYAADVVDATTLIVAGTTYYVAASYDGTTVRLYIDPVFTPPNASLVTTLNVTLGFASIAANGTTAAFFLPGVADEVAFYSSQLSATRLIAHNAAS